MLNKEMFLGAMLKLQKYFGKDLEPSILDMYWDRLKTLPENAFKIGMVNCIDKYDQTSAKPFPLIKDILELCGESGETQAINVVALVKKTAIKYGQYESIDFGDSALHSTINRYGGWPEIVLWGEETWKFNEKKFIAAYKAAQTIENKMSHLPGLLENDRKDNSQYGLPVPEPIRIDGSGRKLLTN